MRRGLLVVLDTHEEMRRSQSSTWHAEVVPRSSQEPTSPRQVPEPGPKPRALTTLSEQAAMKPGDDAARLGVPRHAFVPSPAASVRFCRQIESRPVAETIALRPETK